MSKVKNKQITTETALEVGSEALFGLLSMRLRHSVGYDLLTLLAPNDSGVRLIRHYSSKPDQFPPGEADIVEGTRWFRELFVEKRPVVANDETSIRQWLPDFNAAAALGYCSLINLPIVVSGSVVGLINMMGNRRHFDKRRIEAARNETPLAALVLLTRLAKLPTISIPDGRS
jgi:hypothetical protein